MRRKYVGWAIGLTIVAAGGLFAARAYSMRRAIGPGSRGFRRGVAFLAWKLDLNRTQVQQIRSMGQAEWPSAQPLVQQLAAEQKQMMDATRKGAFDQAAVEAIANRQAQVIAQLIVIKERFLAQAYGILTPEQRVKADAMRQKLSDTIMERLKTQSEKIGGAAG